MGEMEGNIMAGSFNKVILLGNLTRDPELRYTPQGTAVTDIGLAVNETWNRGDNQQRRATFIDVTIWDRAAETVCEYLRKGSPILIEGKLQADSWQDRDTGKMVYKLKVVAQSFQFIGSKSDRQHSGQNNQGDYQEDQSQNYYRRQNSGQTNTGFAQDDEYEDDLPF